MSTTEAASRLMLLRVQLYGAMQSLKGDQLRDFWALIDEIGESRDLFSPEEGEE